MDDDIILREEAPISDDLLFLKCQCAIPNTTSLILSYSVTTSCSAQDSLNHKLDFFQCCVRKLPQG